MNLTPFTFFAKINENQTYTENTNRLMLQIGNLFFACATYSKMIFYDSANLW
jgi:hypothetical protein